MWDSSRGGFFIFVLDGGANTWSNTGTALDERSATRADTLWDGQTLYVASHQFVEATTKDWPDVTPAGDSRLYRFRYDASTHAYTPLGDGERFQIINAVRPEVLVIAKDSTGTLWATWTAADSAGVKKVYVSHTTSGDRNWLTNPIALSTTAVGTAAEVNNDDISSVIAFGGRRIGVMWSNQHRHADTMYFAVHDDGAPDNAWSVAAAYGGPNTCGADDHINLKATDDGTVYAAMKTSKNDAGCSNLPSDPQILLLVRSPAGSWASHVFASIGCGAGSDHTRPIVLVDPSNRFLYMYANHRHDIVEKISPLSPISFSGGTGAVVIDSSADGRIHNVTSTKSNLVAPANLAVLAASVSSTTHRYWHFTRRLCPEGCATPVPDRR